jgi:hypothetical protein
VGQPVSVIEKPTRLAGVIRYETNRVLSGTGHDVYLVDQPILRDRPTDELARRLFARGGIESVHVNGNVVTVRLSDPGTEGIREIIEDLYLYYRPGAGAKQATEGSEPS